MTIPAPHTTHTPGPWIVEPCQADHGLSTVVTAGGIGIICIIQGEEDPKDSPFSKETDEANALLIAAAPELRAALQWLLDDMDDADETRNPHTSEEYDSVAHARTVLAKATGVVGGSDMIRTSNPHFLLPEKY
jgi:hypothetical protein